MRPEPVRILPRSIRLSSPVNSLRSRYRRTAWYRRNAARCLLLRHVFYQLVDILVANRYFGIFVEGIGLPVTLFHRNPQCFRKPDRTEEFLQLIERSVLLEIRVDFLMRGILRRHIANANPIGLGSGKSCRRHCGDQDHAENR